MYEDPYERFIHKPLDRKPAPTPVVPRERVSRSERERAERARLETLSQAHEAFLAKYRLVAEIEQSGDSAPAGDEPAAFNVADIRRTVSSLTGVSLLDLTSDRRGASISKARQIFCWTARRFSTMSLPQIAQRIGRDHSTVYHGIARVNLAIDDLGLMAGETPRAWITALWSVEWPPDNRRIRAKRAA